MINYELYDVRDENDQTDEYDIHGYDYWGNTEWDNEQIRLAKKRERTKHIGLGGFISGYGGYKTIGFPKYSGKRKAKLSKRIEESKDLAKNAKVGDECVCPMCGSKYVKKSYQQCFCSGKCRNKYNNKRKIYS